MSVLPFQPLGPVGPLATTLRKDEQANKRMAMQAETYWKALGHDVQFKVTFNPRFNLHEITSNLKGGLPQQELTLMARRKLTQLFKH